MLESKMSHFQREKERLFEYLISAYKTTYKALKIVNRQLIS